MRDAIKSLHGRLLDLSGESAALLCFMDAVGKKAGKRVLDVGCGYGRNLRSLNDAGFDAVGVEINPVIVESNRRAGLECMNVADFGPATGEFDIILMSHVIEHFAPADLLAFIDGYLDHLRPGGYLVVATPLMSPYFHDDFDHVKPYQPTGLTMVFGPAAAQVQYAARNKLVLSDLWFRRSPLRLHHARGRHLRTRSRFALMAVDLFAAAVFLCSARLIGRTDGWIGVFEKRGGR